MKIKFNEINIGDTIVFRHLICSLLFDKHWSDPQKATVTDVIEDYVEVSIKTELYSYKQLLSPKQDQILCVRKLRL